MNTAHFTTLSSLAPNVYRVRHLFNKSEYALKVLSSHELGKSLLHLQALFMQFSLSHPNVLAVLGFDRIVTQHSH